MHIRGEEKRIIIVTAALIVFAGVLSAGYILWNLRETNTLLERDILSLGESLRITKTHLENTRRDNTDLSELLDATRNTNEVLSRNLEEQFSKNVALESKVVDISGMVQSISGTVGTLQKLSETDEELLKKYSKVYFLSENYIPSRLIPVPDEYLLDTRLTKEMHADVNPFLTDMMRAADTAGIDIKIVSAYRSFDEQISIKTGYKMLYGSGANQFSADQGYSEHQLGTTFDFTTPVLKILSTQFEKDSAYVWLKDNAHRFGFVLSYPKGNAYYQYEPWHWRFVGVQLATKLYQEKKNFYDLTQREIDNYLISIFDR
jgi:LAS superfamily LD-carboxypeptidase LdcB